MNEIRKKEVRGKLVVWDERERERAKSQDTI